MKARTKELALIVTEGFMREVELEWHVNACGYTGKSCRAEAFATVREIILETKRLLESEPSE